MEIQLPIYVAQPSKGRFEASVPFVDRLAQPIEGTSAAQLKEELMFRALELVHEGMDPSSLDALLPPAGVQLINVWLELERQVDPDRPPVVMDAWTHVVTGRFEGDDLVHVWVPRAPGESFAIGSVEEIYEAGRAWALDWVEDNDATDLEVLSADHPARIEHMEVDLGFPSVEPRGEAGAPQVGRMRRPEALEQVATNLTHQADDGGLRRAYGRDGLVDELVDVFTASTPANVCLVGPSGAGKTAVIEEATRRTFELQEAYQRRRDIWRTSGDRIIAGMSIIGQWERRAEAICDELADRNDLLVVEDLLGLVRAGKTYGGHSSVARFIEPHLSQG
ncbi:MAG: hypothetical protein ACOCV2_08965, partial [Persicimonas sp.]